MKKIKLITICLIFSILLSIAGCGADGETMQTDAGSASTVPDIFTTPATEESTESQNGSDEKMSLEEWQNAARGNHGGSLVFSQTRGDDMNPYYEYNGGEAAVTMQICGRGMEACGIGVFLFLDGQIQQYRTADEDTYSYLHTFYLPDNEYAEETLYFIPVCGEAGDTLEIQIMSIAWPDYFLDQGMRSFQHTSGTTGVSMPLVFHETPPEQVPPAVQDRVISSSINQVDLSSSEVEGWTAEQLRDQYEYHYYFNGQKDGGTCYQFTAEDPAVFRYELWGNPAGKYGLVVFVDNQPVSIAPEDLIFIQTQNGKKTVVEVELDLSDFDGSSVIYAVLLARNYFENGMGNGAYEIFRETREPYYLSDAMDIYDLMGWSE